MREKYPNAGKYGSEKNSVFGQFSRSVKNSCSLKQPAEAADKSLGKHL